MLRGCVISDVTAYGQTFPVKGKIINTLCFVGSVVSVAVTQLCHCSTKAVMDIDECSACSSKASFTKKDVGQIWPVDPSLPAPGLECS